MTDQAVLPVEITGLPKCILAPMRVGRVVSVSGGRVIALLERSDERVADLQVGALVKIVRPASLVFGVVEGLSIPIPRGAPGEQELPLAEINLLGEVADGPASAGQSFRRGVSNVPSLDDDVLAANSDDTAAVYALSERQAVRIGSVRQDPTVSAFLSVDDLLARHFAIVGATGTGKSCALALILNGIIDANPNGHILLLDPHGEYGQAFGDRAEHLTVDRLQLPYWILNFEELLEVFFGAEKNEMVAEAQHLRQLVLRARLSYAKGKRDGAGITVDTPTPYTLAELGRLLEDDMGRIDNRGMLGPYLRIKARLAALQGDPRYGFLFPKGVALRDNLSALLGQLFRIPADGKPICILDLVGVPTDVLNVVVAVLCRMAFDLAMVAGHRTPLLLVCEEAHRYAPRDVGLGFEPAKRSLARIAKEGRKYGISLGMVSQRPSDLAVSILSQCSTVLAFRMVNDSDQEVIQAALSDVSAALVTSLPLLGNGEAVVVGEGVAVPMRVRLAQLPPDRKPRSSSSAFSKLWQQDDASSLTLDHIVESWRGARHA